MHVYELRAEHRPAVVGREVSRWHIAPAHRFRGLCRHLLDPVSEVLPIGQVHSISPELRCDECWQIYSEAGSLPAWASARQLSSTVSEAPVLEGAD